MDQPVGAAWENPKIERYCGGMANAVGDRIRARMREAFGDGFTQNDLADAVRMTPDALSRALNGQRQFATLELVRVANYLQTSLHWLATGEVDPAATRVAARHTFDIASRRHESIDWSAERTAIETVATAYTQAFRSVPSQHSSEIPATAAAARKLLLDFDRDFVRRFAEAVESVFGVEVVRVQEATRPYSIEVVGRRVIVVPPHVNWFYQNSSIAHELGHFASGNLEPIEEAPVASNEAERASNAFAAELLLPKAELTSLDWSTMSLSDFADRLWYWGVSTDFVKRRLANLGIVPREDLREVMNMSTQKALRRHLVLDESSMWVDEITDRMDRANTRRFPKGLIRAHMEAVAEGRLRPTYLAWMLETDPLELDRELGPVDEKPDLDWMLEGLERDVHPNP